MRLIIAEKPSVAKAIAHELGRGKRGDGFIQCGDNMVTWCFGHLLEQAEPDEYTDPNIPRGRNGKKKWRLQDLPILPKHWILKPKHKTKKQLSIIGKLIHQATDIVNAGDPDREGQLLVDEVLEHFKNKKAVKRFWVSAQDSVSIQRGLKGLQNNKQFSGWADAARARQRADWLIGMNLSRAYTLQGQQRGARALVTVGRVQTPTLALVVARDREIADFKPIPYHTIEAQITHAQGVFQARWKPKEDQEGLDPEGRLIDTTIANKVVDKVRDQSGEVVEYKQTLKKLNHPTAFALSDITVIASSKYGFSADEVLSICQSLYETHKLTSYPRTDCGFLPESQHADAPSVLGALKVVNPELGEFIDQADPSFKSKTWNDAKVTAHHGIIPTMHRGNKARLSDKERKIYELIVRVYLAQFYPYHEYLSTQVQVDIQNEIFTAQGKVVTVEGWKAVHKPLDFERQGQTLPKMKKKDAVKCTDIKRHDLKTKPPAHFTDGTLTRAMENIHRFVKNPEYKKLLREGDGIGTSATRATIISELKKREFLEMKGKSILSTSRGQAIVDSLPEAVKSPVLTALYERLLKHIETGDASIAEFMDKQAIFIKKQVSKAIGVNDGATINQVAADPSPKKFSCHSCGHPLIRRPSKQYKGYWWGCSQYPTCKQTYPDMKGRPKFQSKSLSKVH